MRHPLSLCLLLIACGGPGATDGGAPDSGDGADAGPADAGPADADTGPVDAGPRDTGRATIIPVETADREALLRLADLGSLPSLGEAVFEQQSSEERPGGDPVDSPLLERGNRDMNHFVCRGAEADIRVPNLVDFRFDEERCAEPYVHGVVLARFEGSGAMVRFWSTLVSIRHSAPDRERFLVWVDDEPEPLIDVPLTALLGEGADEIFAPPFGAGAEAHVAWYYPIVFASKLIVAYDGLGPLDLVYHQTSVRRSEPRTRAATALPERAAASEGLAPPTPDTETVFAVTLAPGTPDVVATFSGPSTLGALGVRSTDSLEGVRVRIAFDGVDAVDLPLLELFAAGLEPAAGPIVDGLTLRLPMPFASEARIEFEAAAATALELFVERYDGVPAEPFGRLHVVRGETVGPTVEPDHLVADLSGVGRLVGVCLMMEGRAFSPTEPFAGPLNFLEGDERLVVDSRPALRGTGTEDYLDSAFYLEEGPVATPFVQAWGIGTEGDVGRASACRWHVRNQAVDFSSSLRFDLEIGPGAPVTLERYRSVAYVYR